MNESRFSRDFRELTGHDPFPWQQALFQRFLSGTIPAEIDIPTGCGKTSVMAVWLLALAEQAETGHVSIPRRLVWVVDRRVVVDQATKEAGDLASRIAEPSTALARIADALRGLSVLGSGDKAPLAISTLRGEKADNRDWSKDPTRPAIIVGTVDMIGSRLLFRGYGDSHRTRPAHAALLGQDALIVNDESHLTPAFASLIRDIAQSQAEPRAVRVLLLSATPGNAGAGFPDDLTNDLRDRAFRDRVQARKRLYIREVADVKAFQAEVLALARKPHAGASARTIIYVRTPEEARQIAEALEKTEGAGRVCLLTGTMRGHERDALEADPCFERFLPGNSRDACPCWLVATSAGEVGINIDAERLISDLDTADHLIQRFGRLNRFGGPDGEAFVIWPVKPGPGKKRPEREAALAETRAYLEGLPERDGARDISPLSVWRNRPPVSAFSPVNRRPPLLPWQNEAWALTSIDAADWRSLPAVEHWLHGATDGEPPQTQIAWRHDVNLLVSEGVSDEDREAALDVYPVLAHERLQEPSFRIRRDKLALLAEQDGDRRVLLVTADGSVLPRTLRTVVDEDLEYGLIILPPGVGMLRRGMFVASPPDGPCEFDVADRDGTRVRYKVTLKEDGWNLQRLGAESIAGVFATLEDARAAALTSGMILRHEIRVEPNNPDAESDERILYLSAARSRGREESEVSLSEHSSAVAHVAEEIGRGLSLPDPVAQALRIAAELHDLGKDRPVWQQAAGNHSEVPVAKSARLSSRRLNGYRHELGSLVEAAKPGRMPEYLDEETRDLVLHLIAAHHGWARPHFPPRAVDREAVRASRAAALEAARRFGRLQDRYGPWGLAYLETLLRCADALASDAERSVAANA